MKVLLCLMAAMTTGTFVLLTLEGQPIKPMEYSLSSEIRSPFTPVHQTLGTEKGIDLGRWEKIAISYCPDDGSLTPDQQLTGSLALNYHFVISNGPGEHDGTIIASPRWTYQLACLNPDEMSNNQNTIKIGLIGDPLTRQRSPKQERRLEALVSSLIRHCHADLQVVWQ